jgi:ribA/ribD-fused uncharacterized protein
MDAIRYFTGEYRFLSNFYLTPVHFMGLEYPSSENAFQAMKTTDQKIRANIRSMTPAMAKRYGRTITLRPEWERDKDEAMLDIIRAKFTNPGLRAALSRTGTRYLFEGNNWHDRYWGICDGHCRTPHNLPEGQNKLGKILEQVRFEIWKNQP